jgi:hypothetical protein
MLLQKSDAAVSISRRFNSCFPPENCEGSENAARKQPKPYSPDCPPVLHGRTAAPAAKSAAMPLLDLTDLELETAARACRAMAYREEQAAKKMENPTTRGPIGNTTKRAAALAEKFERARKQRSA